MTDYELVSLVTNSIMNTANMFMHLFAIVSAYVLAGYVFAHRVSTRMYRLVNFLFVTVFMIMSSTTFASLLHVRSLNLKIRMRDELSWNVLTWMPSSVETVLVFLLPVILLTILVGALAFFHNSRKHGAETSLNVRGDETSAA